MNIRTALALRSALATVLVSWLSSLGLAATTAFDNATQSVYDNGWQTGDNGGVGWGGGWDVDPGGSGVRSYFTGDSDANGSGAGPGIDTPTASGRSWGIRAANSPESQGDATRAFNGTLNVGQTLRIALDLGTLAPGPADGVGGFGIRVNSSNRFEFLATSLSNVYLISDQGGFRSTTVPVNSGGVDVLFNLTAATAYSLTISNRDGGASQTLTGSLSSTGLNTLRVFNFRGGNAVPASDAYFNNIAIVSLPGDFNNDGEVNAADYVIWRKNDNTGNPLLNDLIGGQIGQAQFDEWRAYFGNSTVAGLGSAVVAPSQAVAPEPSAALLLLLGVFELEWRVTRRVGRTS